MDQYAMCEQAVKNTVETIIEIIQNAPDLKPDVMKDYLVRKIKDNYPLN